MAGGCEEITAWSERHVSFFRNYHFLCSTRQKRHPGSPRLHAKKGNAAMTVIIINDRRTNNKGNKITKQITFAVQVETKWQAK